jgi:hypothetical protein
MEKLDTHISEFSSFLLNKRKVLFDNYFLLLTEETLGSSANPLFCVMIPFYLKNDYKIIMINSKESINHYGNILKKFGINLFNNENLCCIDLFQNLQKEKMKVELPMSVNFPYTFNMNKTKNYFSCVNIVKNMSEIEGDKLIQTIYDADCLLRKNEGLDKLILMIDCFESIPIDNLQNFINKLIFYSSEKGSNLVLNINKEISSAESYNFLYNVSDIEFIINNLESGYSKDVDGQIRFLFKSEIIRDYKLRYAIKNNNIDFFPHLVI